MLLVMTVQAAKLQWGAYYTARLVNLCVAEPDKSSEKFTEQSLNSEIVPTAFTTINTTFSDTGQVTAQQPMDPFNMLVQPLPDQSPTEMLGRMVQIAQESWDFTQATSLTVPQWTYDIFSLMLADPFIASVLSRFQYFRADIEIHLRLNTIAMYAGALMLTAVPGAGNNSAVAGFQQARSWLKPLTISAQQQETAVLTLPWIAAQRWLTPADITTGERVLWLVMVDILSQLVSTSVSAPELIYFDVTARFVNAKVTWPIAPSTGPLLARPRVLTIAERKLIQGFDLVNQSAPAPTQYTTRMKLARAPASRETQNTLIGDPNQSAMSQVSQTTNGIASTITSAISSVTQPIESVLTAVQPLMSIAEMIGSFFDKPELVEAPMRVYNDVGANMSKADTKDESKPLTLYGTSYLCTSKVVPDSEMWRLLDIAMRPCLHSQFKFTPSSNVAYIPYVAPGTPVDYLQRIHAYWRGSMRFKLQFFATAFTSARFLLVWTPNVSTSTNTMTNTISQVIDVRGDTSTTFTLPYLSETDYLPPVNKTGGVSVGTLQVTVYNNIVSADATTDPSIDMVVFSAAAPDFQFAYPVQPAPTVDNPWDYPYPNNTEPSALSRRRRAPAMVNQSDIVKEFSESFPPFVAGCDYYTDHHYVASETTATVYDLLKRYQSGNFTPAGGSTVTIEVSNVYQPISTSVGYWIKQIFCFFRGGLRYKFLGFSTGDAQQPVFCARFNDGTSGSGAYFNGSGTACTIQAPPGSTMDFTVPWVDNVPFRAFTEPAYIAANMDNNLIDDLQCWTAVRDDYQLGFLLPAPVYT